MSRKRSNHAKKSNSKAQTIQGPDANESRDSEKVMAEEGTPAISKQSSSLLSGQDPNINYRSRRLAVGALAFGALLVLTTITGVLDFTSVIG